MKKTDSKKAASGSDQPDKNQQDDANAKTLPGCSRRDFIQYSTFALIAAALPLSLAACGGGGGGGENQVVADEPFVVDPTYLEIGDALWVQLSNSPGMGYVPQDAYALSVTVDDRIDYQLRPIFFREGWVGVPVPPMIQSDGRYFDTKEVEVTFYVEGERTGKSKVTFHQDPSATTNAVALSALLQDIRRDLNVIGSAKSALFKHDDTIEMWDRMYELARPAMDRLENILLQIATEGVAIAEALDGSRYEITSKDIAYLEMQINEISAVDLRFNAFWDPLPESEKLVIKRLATLLTAAASGALVMRTRDLPSDAEGAGAIASILSFAFPVASMCVAGNCMRLMEEHTIATEEILRGINWFASIMFNTGLNSIDRRMVLDSGQDEHQALQFATQIGGDFLENVCTHLWPSGTWSNSAPWSNGSTWNNGGGWNNVNWNHTPWNNHAPWNHMVWNNTPPWSHTPWNNTPWNNWNHHTPWSHNPWANGVSPTPWTNGPNPTPWNNTPWNNTPWSNNPWSNNPWSNNPWSNNPWSNNPWNNWNNAWNNFINSGSPKGVLKSDKVVARST
jgi:hypothetical protein